MKKPLLTLCLMVMALPALAGEITVHVKGMVCGFCAQGITKKFTAEDAVEKVQVSLETKTVKMTTKPGKDIGDAKIRAILKDAGYDVSGIDRLP